ncbi:UDP-glucose 4-epimerase [Jannaschia seosinensis]|uniref:UDP-glucose 4-epimerase n=1 Tax=Jannaschia seosinensis TaxID=313367 RepID=A0A0M7B873_9RHOB|nr:SDR family NAD(P)-dependent oxidoreductase [Jannaschia seosinensis]CUH13419.1 UDP-glucose 4-epimerase [Jannaschia seosinensis]
MSNLCLVTGGAGFIGRRLCAELLAEGCAVRVLDDFVEQVHGEAPAQPPEEVEFVRGDVRDPEVVARALDGVDQVFHLAAEVGVGQSMYEIARYVGGNDLGTAVLLEAVIERPVKRLVLASSMSVYGEGLYRTADGQPMNAVRRDPASIREGRWDPMASDGERLSPAPTDESKPVDLASIYALTKYAQEKACLIIGQAYPVEVVALRLFNVFGPGQALSNPYTGVLANFGSRLMNGQPPMVFEDGNQQRDFVHVDDVARAFRLAMEAPDAAGEVVNIGSGHAYRIADVATMLADAMGVDLQPQILGKARAGDIRHCYADISKARHLLGFEPRYLLEDRMGEMAQWIASSEATDGGEAMRAQLETRGLVA